MRDNAETLSGQELCTQIQWAQCYVSRTVEINWWRGVCKKKGSRKDLNFKKKENSRKARNSPHDQRNGYIVEMITRWQGKGRWRAIREKRWRRGGEGELVTLSGPPVKPPSGKCQVTGRDSPPHYPLPSPFSPPFRVDIVIDVICSCSFPFLVQFHKSLPAITHSPMGCVSLSLVFVTIACRQELNNSWHIVANCSFARLTTIHPQSDDV